MQGSFLYLRTKMETFKTAPQIQDQTRLVRARGRFWGVSEALSSNLLGCSVGLATAISEKRYAVAPPRLQKRTAVIASDWHLSSHKTGSADKAPLLRGQQPGANQQNIKHGHPESPYFCSSPTLLF
ncbi:hypothetical protein AAFF_G00004140 [Aldrovandia affinis]|uniref:Uncharacterized protein n=1 Tax=Aldrovandia affinis TaxID=143900 RepID=A0AAD7TDK9_9TELE|nr:hypothetical protein AAFF_G00004140 [Aldrovandia affinis]